MYNCFLELFKWFNRSLFIQNKNIEKREIVKNLLDNSRDEMSDYKTKYVEFFHKNQNLLEMQKSYKR